MKKNLSLILALSFLLNPTFAMQGGQNSSEHQEGSPPASITKQAPSVQEETTVAVSPHTTIDVNNDPEEEEPVPMGRREVNIYENIPGCLDDYLRCVICCGIIAGGWLECGAAVFSQLAVFFVGIATLGDLDSTTRKILGGVAVGFGQASILCQGLKVVTDHAAKKRRETLQAVLEDYKGIKQSPKQD